MTDHLHFHPLDRIQCCGKSYGHYGHCDRSYVSEDLWRTSRAPFALQEGTGKGP